MVELVPKAEGHGLLVPEDMASETTSNKCTRGIPLRIVRLRRTIGEGLHEGSQCTTRRSTRGDDRLIDRTKQVCVGVLRSEDEVMIFEQKVGLVSPFAVATEVLVMY